MLQTQACKAVALLLSALSLSPVSIAKGSPRVSVPRSSSNSSGQRTWQINRGHRAYKLKPPSPPLAIKTEPNLEKSILNADFQVWTTLAIYHFISRQHLSPNACSLPFQALPPRRSLAGMQEHHLLHVCEPEPVYTQFKKNTKRFFFLEKKICSSDLQHVIFYKQECNIAGQLVYKFIYHLWWGKNKNRAKKSKMHLEGQTQHLGLVRVQRGWNICLFYTLFGSFYWNKWLLPGCLCRTGRKYCGFTKIVIIKA